AEFRFDESKIYRDSIDCQFAVLSEDCSAIIPRIEYDATSNRFNGFVTPIDGELKHALETQPRANLVNVHVLQPITDASFSRTPSAAVLSAYGTDNKISSIDILKRWLIIFAEFHSRNIHVLGFSTDGDQKYLRAMRLASNFFVRTQTLTIYNDTLYFTINIPNWSWYFLNPDQIFLFVQVGTHLYTKMRNRLLSQNANLKMGTYKVSTKHLYNLINTKNKMDHNLSKSDLNVRDIQKFSSCQRISDDKVLNLLLLNDHCKVTYNYPLVLNLLILAFINLRFPVHHKIKRLFNEANQNDNNIEVTISQAYEAAQQMATFVGMDKNLIKNHLFEIEESSQMAEKLLNLNTLNESEIIILDSRDNEASDGEGCNEDDDENDGEDDCLEDHTESHCENNINENSFERSDYAEDGDVEDCIDDDVVGSSNEDIHDCCSSDEDLEPTSSLKSFKQHNIQVFHKELSIVLVCSLDGICDEYCVLSFI
ncbi:unnamed protein product, partial [Rotaria magnacalcarata]